MILPPNSLPSRIDRAAAAITGLKKQITRIERLTAAIHECFDAGGHLYTCGNGGSAAEALHLAEELIGRYKSERRPYPAICLAADPTALTCIANDYGFETVFSRQIESLGRPGDALFVFTTSGQSPNILRALESAKARGVRTLGLLGKGGGDAGALCDVALIVDETETAHIQEAHQVVLHLILDSFEGG